MDAIVPPARMRVGFLVELATCEGVVTDTGKRSRPNALGRRKARRRNSVVTAREYSNPRYRQWVCEFDNLIAFLREFFDSPFDSHGLGKGRTKGTRVERKLCDFSRFGRRRTPFSPPLTSGTRVRLPLGSINFFDFADSWCHMGAFAQVSITWLLTCLPKPQNR